jgi:hypothetical protein
MKQFPTFFKLKDNMVSRYYWFTVNGEPPEPQGSDNCWSTGFKKGAFHLTRYRGAHQADIMGTTAAVNVFSSRFVEILSQYAPGEFKTYEVPVDKALNISNPVFYVEPTVRIPRLTLPKAPAIILSTGTFGASGDLTPWSGEKVFGVENTLSIIVTAEIAVKLTKLKNLTLDYVEVTL